MVVVMVAAVEGNNREFTQRRRGRLRKLHLMDFIKVQEKKKKVLSLFPFSVKREIRQFHVVVVQRRQGNVQKSVMHVQSCCFARLNLLFFCSSCCRRRRRCISSLIGTLRFDNGDVLENIAAK